MSLGRSVARSSWQGAAAQDSLSLCCPLPGSVLQSLPYRHNTYTKFDLINCPFFLVCLPLTICPSRILPSCILGCCHTIPHVGLDSSASLAISTPISTSIGSCASLYSSHAAPPTQDQTLVLVYIIMPFILRPLFLREKVLVLVYCTPVYLSYSPWHIYIENLLKIDKATAENLVLSIFAKTSTLLQCKPIKGIVSPDF